MFDIEGAEKLASGGAGFSPDNVEVNTAAPENGNVKFTVTPKGGGEGARRADACAPFGFVIAESSLRSEASSAHLPASFSV